MAGEPGTEVEVPDDAVVTVDLGTGGTATEPKPETKTSAAPRVRPVPEDTAQKALQEAVDPYKRRAEAAETTANQERLRADQAERQRLAREAELDAANEQLRTGKLARITDGIDAATRAIASHKGELKAAMEAGNFELAADVQAKLSKATAALDRWETAKEDFETQKPQTASTEGRVTEQPVVTATPFEQYVSGFAPAAQTWLRAHPECAPANVGGKPDMNAKMMAGHYSAVAQGFVPNSEEYFRVIEEATGYRKKAETVATPAEEEEEQPTPPKREAKPARPSAPPSREPPGTPSQGGTRTVRLSKDEQEMARLSFPHMKNDQERFAAYARNKLELEAEGKLGRTTH